MATEIKYHLTAGGRKIAEIIPGAEIITGPDDVLDLMAEARLYDSGSMIIHKKNLHPDFFDLKTKVAGEILQKFSNYRMKLAIVGDFLEYKSKSLRDFIRESNRTGTIYFVGSIDEALTRLID
ncbi:MAG TPA: DUF4180 domain-containing protein [Bacteroidales bacterium]|nr:DUF4180 domain-containing protein [Bacteroidales bacterium]HBZ20022.1 DUF4180 domain-containing protein [Bacteroidales bacterium]